MAYRKWKVSKIKHCEHVGRDVALESDVVYPVDHLPDQPPRVKGRRCSNALECNQFEKPVCVWCGTNPEME